ncbi:E7 [Apodemus sylvaticus papillomavirus 1]|uniref:Protein E7 n=1 Tax=Apodemus sylvaticus papillomavirus 1 TaxID=1036963 RepID=F8SIM4_9PAPI|nr:E7 [Apodemus sylvaticus papillomavirus 1]AEI00710.1 E7 [Apodemus sylvaticus papillomavirus 1]
MLGPNPTLPDIILEAVDQLVPEQYPDLGSSSLSPDSLGEEQDVQVDPYRVRTTCYSCDKPLRFIVCTGEDSLRLFQQLLLGDLSFLCPGCVAEHLKKKNGRR